ncbi:unnamed protein product [Amoebophrya sp. A120]|nr:unnamed protein product [Amoebophrya sp. A120]|eukprot:GSA120T00005392001.1
MVENWSVLQRSCAALHEALASQTDSEQQALASWIAQNHDRYVFSVGDGESAKNPPAQKEEGQNVALLLMHTLVSRIWSLYFPLTDVMRCLQCLRILTRDTRLATSLLKRFLASTSSFPQRPSTNYGLTRAGVPADNAQLQDGPGGGRNRHINAADNDHQLPQTRTACWWDHDTEGSWISEPLHMSAPEIFARIVSDYGRASDQLQIHECATCEFLGVFLHLVPVVSACSDTERSVYFPVFQEDLLPALARLLKIPHTTWTVSQCTFELLSQILTGATPHTRNNLRQEPAQQQLESSAHRPRRACDEEDLSTAESTIISSVGPQGGTGSAFSPGSSTSSSSSSSNFLQRNQLRFFEKFHSERPYRSLVEYMCCPSASHSQFSADLLFRLVQVLQIVPNPLLDPGLRVRTAVSVNDRFLGATATTMLSTAQTPAAYRMAATGRSSRFSVNGIMDHPLSPAKTPAATAQFTAVPALSAILLLLEKPQTERQVRGRALELLEVLARDWHRDPRCTLQFLNADAGYVLWSVLACRKPQKCGSAEIVCTLRALTQLSVDDTFADRLLRRCIFPEFTSSDQDMRSSTAGGFFQMEPTATSSTTPLAAYTNTVLAEASEISSSCFLNNNTKDNYGAASSGGKNFEQDDASDLPGDDMVDLRPILNLLLSYHKNRRASAAQRQGLEQGIRSAGSGSSSSSALQQVVEPLAALRLLRFLYCSERNRPLINMMLGLDVTLAPTDSFRSIRDYEWQLGKYEKAAAEFLTDSFHARWDAPRAVTRLQTHLEDADDILGESRTTARQAVSGGNEEYDANPAAQPPPTLGSMIRLPDPEQVGTEVPAYHGTNVPKVFDRSKLLEITTTLNTSEDGTPAPDRRPSLQTNIRKMRVGGFQILETLGHGAFGAVHWAQDDLGDYFALKTLEIDRNENNNETGGGSHQFLDSSLLENRYQSSRNSAEQGKEPGEHFQDNSTAFDEEKGEQEPLFPSVSPRTPAAGTLKQAGHKDGFFGGLATGQFNLSLVPVADYNSSMTSQNHHGNKHSDQKVVCETILREVKILQRCEHPNIIRFFDSFVEDSTLVIVMEYHPGMTLQQYLISYRNKSYALQSCALMNNFYTTTSKGSYSTEDTSAVVEQRADNSNLATFTSSKSAEEQMNTTASSSSQIATGTGDVAQLDRTTTSDNDQSSTASSTKIISMLPGCQRWKIFSQVCLALRYLHNKVRITHRDLSPNNCLITPHTLDCKLIDFGLAKIMSTSTSTSSATSKTPAAAAAGLPPPFGAASAFEDNYNIMSHSVASSCDSDNSWLQSQSMCVGSVLYNAPEMVRGEKYTEKVDIWAAGCLLYKMATFEDPFQGTNPLSVARKIVELDYVPLRTRFSSSRGSEVVLTGANTSSTTDDNKGRAVGTASSRTSSTSAAAAASSPSKIRAINKAGTIGLQTEVIDTERPSRGPAHQQLQQKKHHPAMNRLYSTMTSDEDRELLVEVTEACFERDAEMRPDINGLCRTLSPVFCAQLEELHNASCT